MHTRFRSLRGQPKSEEPACKGFGGQRTAITWFNVLIMMYLGELSLYNTYCAARQCKNMQKLSKTMITSDEQETCCRLVELGTQSNFKPAKDSDSGKL